MRFDGKVAFITGGAIGFGRAFARALTAEGAAVAIADIDMETAQQTVRALEADGHPALAVPCDVAREDDVDAAVGKTRAELGGIDILINNAGKHLMKYNQPFTVLPRDEIRALFDVNVIGTINCSVACLGSMRERGAGVILNISSMAAAMSSTPYGVSKLAVRGLTVAFAKEFAPDNIRVNGIAPGAMATENALIDLPPDMMRDFIDQNLLIKRMGTMDDIVAAMLYLCSDEASYVTGETLSVTGGFPLFL
jgi:NAD(P)-dependent dehydrogenase (short-subunit alcohol dehydrogenase family)